jgi:hydroxypyruvate isomerase
MNYVLDWPRERLSANVSTLFADRPVLDRPRAAVAAGFSVIESWWPFPDAEPGAAELDRFAASVTDTGVRVASLNFLTGDRARNERGLPATAAGTDRFRRNIPVAVGLAGLIGEAARVAADSEIGVMVEPLSAVAAPDYAVRTVADVRRVIEAVADTGAPPVRICYDVYHLGQEDPASLADIAADVEAIGHVQLADAPGRGEPGTGRLPIAGVLDQLARGGYLGDVGLEFVPTDPVGSRSTR